MNNDKLKWGFVYNGGESRLILGNAIVKPSNEEMTNEEIFASVTNFLNDFELVEDGQNISTSKDIQWAFTYVDGESKLFIGHTTIRPSNDEMSDEEIFSKSKSFLNNFELAKNEGNFLDVHKKVMESTTISEPEVISEYESVSEPEIESEEKDVELLVESESKPPIKPFIKAVAPVLRKSKEITNPEFGARIKVKKNNNPVFENIYLDVKKRIADEFVSTDVAEIIKSWYESLGDNSAMGYAYAYIKHFKDEGGIEEIGKVIPPNGTTPIKKYRRIKKSVEVDPDYLKNLGEIEEKVKLGVLN